MLGERAIMTFGLTESQNAQIPSYFPAKDYRTYAADCPADLIAVSAVAYILNAGALDTHDLEMLLDYYTEVSSGMPEAVIWLGEPKPPEHLLKFIKCYDSFEAMTRELKYLLLTAHKRVIRTVDFSRTLDRGIRILSLIRKYPGISTRALSEKTELSMRTVQRYITSLQMAGEWIVYDTASRGWELQYGVSILFGDCINDDEKMMGG